MRITEYKPVVNRHTNRVELAKERAVNYPKKVSSPFSVATMINDLFCLSDYAEEKAYMVSFNSKLAIQGVFELSHGVFDQTHLSVRSVYSRALMIGSVGIVIVHNHPSGDSLPSNVDIKTTKKIQEAGKLLEVSLMDHIIIGGDTYYSFAEEGLLE